jgi:hypothetical protein
MPKQTTLSLVETAGTPYCVASDDGQKVHNALVQELHAGNPVCISFKGVEDLTSAFLNAAIGQLYGEFREQEIRTLLLPPTHASPDDLGLLKRVVDRAKEFFKDPERFTAAAKEVLGEDD